MNPAAPTSRLLSLDVFRGFVMLLMMAEVMVLPRLLEHWPGRWWAELLAFHQSHVAWVGCSLHDLIQPSFSFLVGTAMMYSLARRKALGEGSGQTWRHAAVRSLVLIFLGVFLRSVGAGQTYFTFEDTLTQIGLGYFFLYFIAPLSVRGQWCSLVVILLGYWLVFLLYPAPGAGYDWQTVGWPEGWAHAQTGLAAHWNLNGNAAWAFDVWFLNLFPRETPFTFHEGGYSTLSFIPTLGTMVLGLIAGGLLQSEATSSIQKVGKLLKIALMLWALGLLWHFVGQCPIVKKIWTPSWALFSGGSCFALLACCYWLLDARKTTGRAAAWCFPLRVIGVNSIVAYFIAHLWVEFFRGTYRTHVGWLLAKFPTALLPQIEGFLILVSLWGCLYVLWKRKWFIRV